MIRTDDAADHLAKLERILEEQGVVALLRQLNARTPFRFTAIYRYDAPMLRNVYFVDAFEPETTTGSDVVLADSYCALVGPERPSLEVVDATSETRFAPLNNPVMSYCGVLLMTPDGVPFGSVCHHDVDRCESNGTELSLLQTLSGRIMAQLAVEHPELVPSARSLSSAPLP